MHYVFAIETGTTEPSQVISCTEQSEVNAAITELMHDGHDIRDIRVVAAEDTKTVTYSF